MRAVELKKECEEAEQEGETCEEMGGLVRRRARPRYRTASLHRRDLGLDEHGEAPRRSAKRRAARAGMPQGHWKTNTFVAGLRLTGLVASMVLDGPINRNALQAYVDEVLVRALSPGEVVVLDTSADIRGVRLAAPLWLTSPDFVPYAYRRTQPDRERLREAQSALRKAAERTVDALWTTIGRLLDAFTPTECANCFRAAGYEPE